MNEVCEYTYNGYTFTTDGTIKGVYGKKLKAQKQKVLLIKTQDEHGNITKRAASAARIMYELHYHVKLSPNQVIKFRNGDSSDISIENLYLYKKNGEENRNASRRKKRVLSDEQRREIRNLYSNSDGHCKSQWSKEPTDYSIRDLARKYHVSVHTIQIVLAGE